MLSKAKAFMGLGKPKAQHSLDNLKYLASILTKNQTVTENNKDILIETMRSITEILIWGDQNDSSVFDYFLEKQMITYFLHFMKQKLGRYICTQLLQTLNILFENISNETSLYYLLSNNHVNNIILNKFDFVEEEVMAYYISFLKTLSFKLNSNSIHFFFNERASEFPLFVEAIKFFDHPESFVRIYVRQITLNIYKVPSKQMIYFIETKTTVPYFSNLIWFIRNHVLDLDSALSGSSNDINRNNLTDSIDEFIDHLNYLQDIFAINQDLNIDGLKDILFKQLLKRFIVPLCINSIFKKSNNSSIRPLVAIFSLCQLFMNIKYEPIIRAIFELTLENDEKSFYLSKYYQICNLKPESLTECLMQNFTRKNSEIEIEKQNSSLTEEISEHISSNVSSNDEKIEEAPQNTIDFSNITDDEKLMGSQIELKNCKASYGLLIESLFNYFDVNENDQYCLLVICLFWAMVNTKNWGTMNENLEINLQQKELIQNFINGLLNKLVNVISMSVELDTKIRFATVEIAAKLIKKLNSDNTNLINTEPFMDSISKVEEKSIHLLRSFYKNEETFLDIFEAEYEKSKIVSLNIESLLRDSSILLEPSTTPLSGVELYKRLPCGEMEKFLYSLKLFFLVRDLSLTFKKQPESQLPLTKQYTFVQENDSLDLNTSDLIACTVITQEKKERRFLVIDPIQFILVEPETQRIGWGIVKFSDLIQDVEVIPDKEDSKSINITISRPTAKDYGKVDTKLSAKFTFDDNIRCMGAKQHLVRARERVRKNKLESISRLLGAYDTQSLCLTLNDIHVVNSISSMTTPVSPTWKTSLNNFKRKSLETKQQQ